MTETRWLTRQEAADLLKVNPRTVDRYARQGKLTKHKARGTQFVVFPAAEVEALATPVKD